MKQKIQSRFLFGAAMLGFAFMQSGCATTSMQRSDQTRAKMVVVEADYKEASAQVEVMGTQLKAIVKPGELQEGKVFKRYSVNVRKMADLKKRLFEHADQMRAKQRAYFEEWRMEGNKYDNPEIQALSEQRRSDLQATFARIARASVGVKGSFKSYINNIEEIQKYLENDLTANGVEAITPTVWKAVRDGEDLSNEIQPVLIALEDARLEMKQRGN